MIRKKEHKGGTTPIFKGIISMEKRRHRSHLVDKTLGTSMIIMLFGLSCFIVISEPGFESIIIFLISLLLGVILIYITHFSPSSTIRFTEIYEDGVKLIVRRSNNKDVKLIKFTDINQIRVVKKTKISNDIKFVIKLNNSRTFISYMIKKRDIIKDITDFLMKKNVDIENISDFIDV